MCVFHILLDPKCELKYCIRVSAQSIVIKRVALT